MSQLDSAGQKGLDLTLAGVLIVIESCFAIARDGLRARTTRERSVSRSGFRVIGPISCKRYLNPTGIGLIPSENSHIPDREREGLSSKLSGSGLASQIPDRDRAGIGSSESNKTYPN